MKTQNSKKWSLSRVQRALPSITQEYFSLHISVTSFFLSGPKLSHEKIAMDGVWMGGVGREQFEPHIIQKNVYGKTPRVSQFFIQIEGQAK